MTMEELLMSKESVGDARDQAQAGAAEGEAGATRFSPGRIQGVDVNWMESVVPGIEEMAEGLP